MGGEHLVGGLHRFVHRQPLLIGHDLGTGDALEERLLESVAPLGAYLELLTVDDGDLRIG